MNYQQSFDLDRHQRLDRGEILWRHCR